jgi:BspA type Leucine rich repeat region (6 copies)
MRVREHLTLLPLMLLLALPRDTHAQFTFTTNNGALTITGYSGNATTLVIPGATNGYPITGIGAGAFLRRSSLTNVLLPDSITMIGDSAFYSCSGLATINFPANLATIGASAFNGCKLTTVAIPQTVTNIGYRAFAGCSTLEQITVDGLNPYYCDLEGVLFNRSRTTLIQCPARRSGSYGVTNTVTAIGDAAFSGSALHRIALPFGVTNIGASAFSGATVVTNVDLPPTVAGIGAYAFSGCGNLLTAVIPDGVASIETYTFYRCTSLTNFSLGRGVITIQASAFYGCSGLTELTIPDNVTNLLWQAFIDCSGLRRVWVGKGVASIGDSAFLGCVNLAGIYFTGNAPSVGSSIFGYSSVVVYYLPQTTGWGPNLGGWPTKLWNPAVQITAPSFGPQLAGFGLPITGTPDIPIVLEVAAQAGGSPWTPLLSGRLTNGSIHFRDADWTNFPTRFYRIRSP